MLPFQESDSVHVLFGRFCLNDIFLRIAPANHAHEQVQFPIIALARPWDEISKSFSNRVIVHPVATGVFSGRVAVTQRRSGFDVGLICEIAHVFIVIPLLRFHRNY